VKKAMRDLESQEPEQRKTRLSRIMEGKAQQREKRQRQGERRIEKDQGGAGGQQASRGRELSNQTEQEIAQHEKDCTCRGRVTEKEMTSTKKKKKPGVGEGGLSGLEKDIKSQGTGLRRGSEVAGRVQQTWRRNIWGKNSAQGRDAQEETRSGERKIKARKRWDDTKKGRRQYWRKE